MILGYSLLFRLMTYLLVLLLCREGRKKQNLKCVRYSVDGECRVLIVANRDIAKGERLYYDYNGYEHEYPTEHFIWASSRTNWKIELGFIKILQIISHFDIDSFSHCLTSLSTWPLISHEKAMGSKKIYWLNWCKALLIQWRCFWKLSEAKCLPTNLSLLKYTFHFL